MSGLREHRWLLAVLLLCAPFYAVWTWTAVVGDIGNDAVDYLLMAAHYSPYAASDPVTAQAAAFSRFPPLYPLILAWTGSAVADLHRAHAITTAFLFFALVAFYALLRESRVPRPFAALLALSVAALPGSWMNGLNLLSEYPYLCFSLLTLCFVTRYRHRSRLEDLYAAALCVSLAALTRTVGAALFAPLLFAACAAPRRAAALAIAIAAAPLLLWHGLHRADHGYGSAILGYYASDSVSYLHAQLAQELPALRRGFAENLGGFRPLRPAADALGLLSLAATVWRLRRGCADAAYLAAYLGMLLVWPYPNVAARLLWEVTPVLLVQPVLLLLQPGAGAVAPDPLHGRLPPLIALLLLLSALPAIRSAAEIFDDAGSSGLPGARGYEGWYDPDPRHAVHRVFSQLVIADALRQIPELVPEGECVIAPRTDLVSYYGHRRAEFPPLQSVPDPLFMQALRASGCRYLFMYNAVDDHFPVPLHPLQRLGGQLRVLRYFDFKDPPGGDPAGRVTCVIAQLRP